MNVLLHRATEFTPCMLCYWLSGNQRSIHKNDCMGFHSLKYHYLMSGVNCEVYWDEEGAISDRDKIMIYSKYMLLWFNISSEKKEKIILSHSYVILESYCQLK